MPAKYMKFIYMLVFLIVSFLVNKKLFIFQNIYLQKWPIELNDRPLIITCENAHWNKIVKIIFFMNIFIDLDIC